MLLVRITLIVAIIAALAATGIGIVKVKDSIVALRDDRDNEKRMKEEQIARATKAEKALEQTTAQLKREQSNHQETRNKLDQANSQLAEARKNIQSLTAELDKTKAEKVDAQQKLAAWSALGVTPDQVKKIQADLEQAKKTIDAIEAEKKILASTVARQKKFIEDLLVPVKDEDKEVPLPTGLKGTVVAVDPRWEFVVLDIGENQDVREGGVLKVHRDGKLLGKVKVRTVFPDKCIANILPEWKFGEIREGDQVLY
jgi:DNA-binding protein H-NS